MTPRRAMLAILGFQIGMAVVLAGSDLIRALPRLLAPSNQPALDTPVRPGDQVRRFRPGDLPNRPTSDPARTTPLPNPGDMPSRLRFEAPVDGTALVTGTIAPGDAARFADWLAGVAGVEALRLHSPGGSVMDALGIGRALRDAGLATVMDPGDICFSACPYILSGGVSRTVTDDALVGVHQHYFGENTALPAFLAVEDIQRGQGEVMAYLDEMGIDVRLMEHALTTPPEDIYVLLPAELRTYRVVTPENDIDTD
jgi:hypothetical protein